MSHEAQELLIAHTSTGKLTAIAVFNARGECGVQYKLLVKRNGTVRTLYARDAAEKALRALGGVRDTRSGLET